MLRKYWWVVAAVGIALAAVVVLRTRSEPRAAAPSQPTVRISAGLTRVRGFKPLGESLVAEYEKVMPDVRFVVLESPGSVRNLQNLQRGEADLGFAQADLAYMGYNGQLPDAPERLSNIRGIAVMHPSMVHLLVRNDLPIRSIADLEGRRVGVGPSDSGTAVTSELLLSAFNLQRGKVAGFAVPSPQAIDRLVAGELDAAFVVSADPAEEVRRATQAGARLVDIGGAEVDRFRSQYPFLRPGVIPGGLYDHHPEPVRTLAIDVLLLARKGLDERLVHRLTQTFFEVLPRVAQQVEFIRTMDPTRAPATPVPLHPGAALYYRERELSR
jgi:TRAP transporter TAXI family solute receptor